MNFRSFDYLFSVQTVGEDSIDILPTVDNETLSIYSHQKPTKKSVIKEDELMTRNAHTDGG
jgi:hypothetical protein